VNARDRSAGLDSAPVDETEPVVRLRVERAVPGPGVERSTLELRGERITLGRDRGADIVLHHPGASRRHARIVRARDAWWVEPTAALGVTSIGAFRVRSGRYRLRPGDRVRVPGATLRAESRPAESDARWSQALGALLAVLDGPGGRPVASTSAPPRCGPRSPDPSGGGAYPRLAPARAVAAELVAVGLVILAVAVALWPLWPG